MLDLGMEAASCIVISKDKKTIPNIETDEELKTFFMDGFKGSWNTLHPADNFKWS